MNNKQIGNLGVNKRRTVGKVLTGCMIISALWCLPERQVNAAGGVSIDGDFSEWKNAPMMTSNTADIQEWSVVRDEKYVYFYVHELCGNQYDHTTQTVDVKYKSGSNTARTGWGASEGLVLPGTLTSVKDKHWADIPGASISYAVNPEKGYDVECAIPAEYFETVDESFSLSYVGAKVSSSEISSVSVLSNGEEPQEEKTDENALENPDDPLSRKGYEGVKIDGKFSDWDFKDTASVNNDNLKGYKAIWDDEYLYVYLEENEGSYYGNAGNTGSRSTGQFAIITENNRKTTFFLKRNWDGTAVISEDQYDSTKGMPGAKVASDGHRYEIKIPVSKVKDIQYSDTLAFAIYGTDADDRTQILESGISEINGKHQGEKNKGGFAIDGKYDDWAGYEVQDIDYTTSGGKGPDGVGSLYFDHDQNLIYGHTYGKPQNVTTGQYINDITPFSIYVNHGNDAVMLTAFLVDDKGTVISKGGADASLPAGTYKYVLVDVGTPAVEGKTNIYSKEMQKYNYGEIILTAGNQNYEGKNVEAEFAINAETIREHYKLEEHDLKTVQAQFQDLGNERLTTQGASSGPLLGLMLCFATVGLAGLYRKKKYGQMDFGWVNV